MFPANLIYRALGFWGILSLVVLRIVIGWHFFKEGVTKVQDGNFASSGFLGGAKGPLADQYHGMLPDYEGLLRLDRDKMVAAYQAYSDQSTRKYGFNSEQKKQAEALVADAIARWDSVAHPEKGQFAAQIREYREGLDRMEKMAKDEKWSGVASLRKQHDEIETKWRGLVKPALTAIDKSHDLLEDEMMEIFPERTEQYGRHPFEIGTGALSVRTIDKIIPIFDMSIGILLIIGLLTPLAGIAAGLFLASVVLSQFPGYPGTQPTYFQAVEMVACFVLAFTDSGRFAGLDFLPWAFWNRRAADK